MPAPTNKDTFVKELYEKGCEFCGAKVPAQDYFGLENAHIISSAYAPEHRWNTFTLCGNCHHILDKVVKPRIFSALRIAATGFYDNPQSTGEPPFVVAHDWKLIIERLDAEIAAKNPLPSVDKKKIVWKNRNRPNKPLEPTATAVTPAADAPGAPSSAVAHH
jgi:predicted restriction endonuclease